MPVNRSVSRPVSRAVSRAVGASRYGTTVGTLSNIPDGQTVTVADGQTREFSNPLTIDGTLLLDGTITEA